MYIISTFQQAIYCFNTLYAFCRSFKQLKKSFFGCLILPGIVGQMRQTPCLILNIFRISTIWVTTLNVCVYSNSMIYRLSTVLCIMPISFLSYIEF